MNEIELTERLGAIHRKIMKRLTRSAAAEGISLTEAVVLFRVYRAGPSRVCDIGAHVGLSPSTLTGILDRLVARGWLERESDPHDRRAIVMKSTPKLVEFMKTSMDRSSERLAKSFRALPADMLDRLVADLGKLFECLEADEENDS
jgi:DNA-binding MarR family transcriptional regulator